MLDDWDVDYDDPEKGRTYYSEYIAPCGKEDLGIFAHRLLRLSVILNDATIEQEPDREGGYNVIVRGWRPLRQEVQK